MKLGLSTHVFLPQRLRPALLDAILRSGASAIEIFAARFHFDYTDRVAVREIAHWFHDAGALPTLHQPLSTESRWSRHSGPSISLIDPEKARRIDAMDEVKRALETAEQIPFRSITLHLGQKDDGWSPRSLENSLSAIEHIKAFAQPLGVQVLLENLENEVTTPAHLLEILEVGHFDTVGVNLDVGHAHLTASLGTTGSLEESFRLLSPRIVELHLHDNGGEKDEHLWPGSAPAGQAINWTALHELTSTLPGDTRGILEITHEPEQPAEEVCRRASAFFSEQARLSEQLQSS